VTIAIEVSPANLALIVRAVNAHEELVAAAQKAAGVIEDYCTHEEDAELTVFPDVADALRGALAKAEGKEQCSPSSQE
jgi:hypothetical protein